MSGQKSAMRVHVHVQEHKHTLTNTHAHGRRMRQVASHDWRLNDFNSVRVFSDNLLDFERELEFLS